MYNLDYVQDANIVKKKKEDHLLRGLHGRRSAPPPYNIVHLFTAEKIVMCNVMLLYFDGVTAHKAVFK